MERVAKLNEVEPHATVCERLDHSCPTHPFGYLI
ncbi:hypothetical protein DSUL_260021 [Desulfovibrionales bacterium]